MQPASTRATGSTSGGSFSTTEKRTEARVCQRCQQEFEDTYTVFYTLGRAMELKHKHCPACQKEIEEEEECQRQEEYRVRCTRARCELLYESGLPVFVCSNYNLAELELLMGKATVSRLYEMVEGRFYEMMGSDYRRKVGGNQ